MITAIRHLLLWNWQAGVESSTMSEERLSSKAILGVNRIKECGLRICMSEGESSVLPLRCKLHKKCTLRWGEWSSLPIEVYLSFLSFLYYFPRQLWCFTIFHYIKVTSLGFCYGMIGNWTWGVSHTCRVLHVLENFGTLRGLHITRVWSYNGSTCSYSGAWNTRNEIKYF